MNLPSELTLITIGITAVVTASAAQAAIWVKEHYLSSREGKFSALYAALFFEGYAVKCSDALGESNNFRSSGGHAGSWVWFPTLPEFPKEIDWRKVGIDLTEKAFGFRVETEFRDRQIADCVEHDFPDGGQQESLMACAEFGLKALDLAERFRESKRLTPAVVPNPEFTVMRHLQENRTRLRELQRKVAEYERSLPKDF